MPDVIQNIDPVAQADPIYRLPPDFTLEFKAVTLSETHDWSLISYGIPKLWSQTRGKGVKICILDTGVDLNHPDLQGAIADAQDFTRSFRGVNDQVGHGTWCAGMCGARAGNDLGVAGIAPECTLYVGKVLGDNGAGSDQTIAAGLQWAMSPAVDADIVSMSLGGPQMSNGLRELFKRFVSRPRKFIFAAAGNDGPNSPPNYPGAWPETISVAAVDKDGNITAFSSRGDYVNIAGPGYKMLSTIPGGYGEMSGTCVAEGEYVYTPQGPRRIEQIKAGDTVYAQKNGRIVERVVYGVHDRGENEVHRLAGGGRDVMATASHEMLAFNKRTREPEWVRLGQLQSHHRLVVPRGLASQVNPYLDATLSDDFCWLAGFFTGDGWISYTNRGMRSCFASGDKPDVIGKVERIYSEIVGKQLRQDKSGSWHYDDCTRMAMVIDCMGLNSPASQKTIPLWVWSLSEEKQLRFYEGYRAADGHVFKSPDRGGISDSYDCSAGDLVRRLACWADYRGWKHSVVKSRTRHGKAPSSKYAKWSTSHSLQVYRSNLGSGWMEATGIHDRAKAESVAMSAGIDPQHYATVPARILDRYSRRSKVYDLTVPDADCFITQGVVTHNSMATPFVAAIGALALAKHISTGATAGLENMGDMLAALKKSAKDKGVPGRDKEYGWGLVDAEALLKGLEPQPPEPEPLPAPEDGREIVIGGVRINFPSRLGDLCSVSRIA